MVLNVDYRGDQNNSNNSSFWTITVITRKSTLHINEIKFQTFDGEPEWVEIYNSGNEPVFLKG